MRAPEFWSDAGGAGRWLAPLALLHGAASRCRRRWTTPWRAPVPVICVGNLVAGGAGKTPVALALGLLLRESGHDLHYLSRGHGGRLRGPVLVDSARHDARDVGDEAFLLAEIAPCWIARDRVAGARAAIVAGARIIVMDDGFQNPSLAKDLSLLVIDGGYGFGNGLVMPAGPLRETRQDGLARSDAVVLMEPDTCGVAQALGQSAPPILAARLVPLPSAQRFSGRKVLAFAGIGRPEKFFAFLEDLGCILVGRHGFDDHHCYRDDEIFQLVEAAHAANAVPVTTAKDYARLNLDSRAMVEVAGAALEWRNPAQIETLLARLLDA
jgi:tetraacyldisaccharide 4'-kinase